MLRGLLTADVHQRIRLAQSGLASLLMVASVLLMHYARWAGLSDGRWLWTWTAFSLVGMLGVFALIRTGWSLRLRDPSMTLAQMLYAIACAASGYLIAGAAHPMVPLILAVILMFGMFGLSNREMLLVGAYTLLLFGGVMAWTAGADPQRYPASAQAITFGMVVVVVSAVIVLNARLLEMRTRLHEQRQELQQAVARIGELASHDELTGLVNRRRMRELLEQDRQRSERDGHPWCVALVDLDHFKRINDKHGHAVGDAVLRELARRGLERMRKSDVLARWGGEEFVLLLHGSPLGPAAHGVERWREHLTAVPMRIGTLVLPMRFSAGVAQHRAGEAVEQTLARADRALYEAKARGRNCVVSESDE